MTGFKSKRAMSDSRFAVLYEDPDYELFDEDAAWEDYVAEQAKPKQGDEYDPFQTVNS